MTGPQTDANATRDARIGRALDELAGRLAAGELRGDESDDALLAPYPGLADELRPHLALLRDLHAVRRRDGVEPRPDDALYHALFSVQPGIPGKAARILRKK